MRKLIFLSILCLIILLLVGCSNNNINNQNNVPESESNIDNTSLGTNNSSAYRTSFNTNIEEELSVFSTTIDIKESGRQHNIELTCSFLNSVIVKSGETFSFCDTVGEATPDRGYEKADVFDKNGNIIKGYGGGNCQISSTLYNAVLQLPSLVVTERHSHSRKVTYVEPGKDAAVSYGSVDLKFRNDYGFDIKIYCSTDTETLTVKIVKI